MSFDQTDKIDFVNIEYQTGDVLLSISDHLDWLAFSCASSMEAPSRVINGREPIVVIGLDTNLQIDYS
jgi:hypothetical protein